MNRRQLFLSTAKAALVTAFGGTWLFKGAQALAQAAGFGAMATPKGNALGSTTAARAIPGNVLPAHNLPFGGLVNLQVDQSKPWWQPKIVPPKGAPNVLLILLDDCGYGAPSTFGGVIPTPTLDRVAANGLRYTNFHSTSLCSPTRAALITGRNHHSAGFGVISEIASGFPGYDSVIGRDNATVGRILLENGYRTSWFGKNHNTPVFQTSQAGPFDQWPTGMGFEYFYGFMGGDASQWQPGSLHRNTTPITPWVGNPGWNLITAMTDEAVGWVNELNDIDPSLPFFLYYAPGATHSPHHPTPEWVKKISDMHLFDKGWNALRDQIFEKQKKLGVIPQDAKLTPWPHDLLKNWDELSEVEKRLFIRQADVFAAFLAYVDHEIGRVIQKIEDMGKLDDTLIIFITGDNGCSSEGSVNGTPNEVLPFNGVVLPAADMMPWYDVWGTDQTYPHFAVGWSWAFDTPYKWMKQIPSFFGGTRQGTVISWPARIKDKGGLRWQFHHVIDVVPTILEATGIQAPDAVDGIGQKPIEGVSMVYTFDKANADAPSTRHTQYFEMLSVQGLYNDGWMLSGVPIRAPWELAVKSITNPATAYKYELYDLSNDWTQYTDVAAQNPLKVKEMTDLMFGEFAKYQVLPLDGSAAPRFVYPRPSFSAGRTVFKYSGQKVRMPNGTQPSLLNTSYTITAEIEVPQGGADGMIINQGGRFGGYGMYLLKSKLMFVWNLLLIKQIRWEGPALSPGKHTLVFDFEYEGLGEATLAYDVLSGIGRGGMGTLSVDGAVVATQKMERTIPLLMPLDDAFTIADASGPPLVDEEYQMPFPFTGKLNGVTITVAPPVLTEEDKKKLEAANRDGRD
jgi:arylsulfatase